MYLQIWGSFKKNNLVRKSANRYIFGSFAN